uniref:RING-type domain-containing protein n=1 Tax=Oryzias latipes TaxID=8090 RepID=A0A3P9L4V4_ORYLA
MGSDPGLPCPDLECSICFTQFNNVFRCPKMLHCKHTFCLECLARINVKSAEPNAIQCPLCRGLTTLPTLGLPKLATDSDVLSYLPAAMQRVYTEESCFCDVSEPNQPDAERRTSQLNNAGQRGI